MGRTLLGIHRSRHQDFPLCSESLEFPNLLVGRETLRSQHGFMVIDLLITRLLMVNGSWLRAHGQVGPVRQRGLPEVSDLKLNDMSPQCLILDIDFKKKWATDSWEEFDKTPGKRILLCSKTLMVIVLQMICLREFLAAMKPLAFIVNPITWREVWRPSSDKPKLFHALICVPVCFMAELFQFIIAYTVAASSMTIILQSDHVTDVVFNGLVITFLTDLDESLVV